MTSIYFTSPPNVCIFSGQYRGRRGRDHMVVGFILLMQSVPITTNLSFRFQRKFVSDLRQVGGFLRLLRHDIAEILLKVALNTIAPTLTLSGQINMNLY